MANVTDIKKTLGYAGKNFGKTTKGHCWTNLGVVRIGVYAAEDHFIVEYINGVKTSIRAELNNISGAVQGALSGDHVLCEKVLKAS